MMQRMSETKQAYDLVVIGSGPAGIAAAVTAIALGKTVAVVDNQPGLGGSGINTVLRRPRARRAGQ